MPDRPLKLKRWPVFMKNKPDIISFVGGLGGRDMSANSFEYIIEQGIKKAKLGRFNELEMIEVRE